MTGHALVYWVFAGVYLGMLLGRYPRLGLDRSGIALLGAIVLLASGTTDLDGAVAAVDWATISVLFALMVVSAQLRLGGFYTRVSAAVATRPWPPAGLLAALVAVTGGLSAVFTNDIVCLAVSPVVILACRRRGLDPLPYLLGVACAANVGSAATLIGNPQNILVGERLGLDFGAYLGLALPPVLAGLAVTWAVLAWQYRGRWHAVAPTAADPAEALPAWDGWQSGKGLAVTTALFLAFLLLDWPRHAVALAAAGILLTSRRLHSRQTLGLVDWQLLVLFVGLFVVNAALQATGLPERAVAGAAGAGIDLAQPGWLFAATLLLSNLVSNVPAVMLLLPLAEGGGLGGPLLALASTLAGNLLLVGSIANLIVADAAARHGVRLGWAEHARSGVPVTLLTLALAAGWLGLLG
ncbi:MAG TPA: anion transporter [Gammaproteobacteria bacterium]